MFVEVHYDGVFKKLGKMKKYVGGKMHLIKDFSSDEWSWFEMRYHFKQLGIFDDFTCYQRLPGKDFEDGLVVIDCDLAALKSMEFLDYDQNVEYYIEHLAAGTGFKELLPDYCKPDSVSDAVKGHEYQKKANRVGHEHQKNAKDHEQETVAGDTLKYGVHVNDNNLNDAEKERGGDIYQTEDEDRELDEDKEVSCDTESVIFDKKGKKIVFGDMDEDNDDDVDEEEDNIIGDAEQHEVESVNKSVEIHEAATVPEGFESGSKSHENCNKKGGRPRKHERVERVIGGPDCDIENDMESYYSNTNSLHTPVNSEDEEVSSTHKYPTFNEETDMSNPIPQVGMEFEGPTQFRDFIRQYGCMRGYDFKFPKNDSDKTICVCKEDGCPFRAYASFSQDNSKYILKSLRADHNCGRATNNKQVRSGWIASKYLEFFRADPNFKVQVLKAMINRDLSVNVKKMTLYRARNIALDEIDGKHLEQFRRIRDYANQVILTNPGSRAIVSVDPVPGSESMVTYNSIFITFPSMVKGLLKGCRRIIGMDGCHLKSIAGGCLLAAVARDGNNQMFPVAYAAVRVECKESWSWFITNLLESIGVDNVAGWTFITDRQKGLVESLRQLVPTADVRFCVRHMYGNFRERWRGLKLKNLIWKAATAYRKEDCLATLYVLKKECSDGYDYLNEVGLEMWTRSHFNTESKCDLLCNNICEAFNKYILETRDKPIITMLEMIRRMLMVRFQYKELHEKHIAKHAGRSQVLCPKIQQKIKEQIENSRDCIATFAGEETFEVHEKGKAFVLNLEKRMCDCKEWNLTGIPCRHAVACIREMRRDIETHVHDMYRAERYKLAYEGIIHPVPDSSIWERVECTPIHPPPYKRGPGRPKKARKKGVEEPKNKGAVSKVGTIIKCSNCQEIGHNARTCKNPHVTKPVKVQSGNKGGRPRKIQKTTHASRVEGSTTANVPLTSSTRGRGGGVSRGRGNSIRRGGSSTGGRGSPVPARVDVTTRGGSYLGSVIPNDFLTATGGGDGINIGRKIMGFTSSTNVLNQSTLVQSSGATKAVPRRGKRKVPSKYRNINQVIAGEGAQIAQAKNTEDPTTFVASQISQVINPK